MNQQPPTRRLVESFSHRLAVATAFSLLAIASLGYYAWDNDQLWNLVPLLRAEDGLFAYDWFAQHAIASNVHIGFNTILSALRWAVPSLDARLLIGQTASTILFAWVILYALRAFDIRSPHPALALLIVFLGARLADGIGAGNATWDIYLVPRIPAHALIVLALALHHRGRPLAAGLMLGGAGLLHASAGLAGLVLLASVIVVSPARSRVRELILCVGIGVLIALPVLIPTIAAQLAGASDNPNLVLDIYRFRMPYRDPLQWRWQHWVMFALVNAHLAALLSAERRPAQRYLAIAAVVILGLSVVQWTGVAVGGSLLWFKSMLSDRLLPIWRVIYLLTLIDAMSTGWSDDRAGARWRWALFAVTIWNKWLFAPVIAWDLATHIACHHNSPNIRRIGEFMTRPVALTIPLLCGMALFALTAPSHYVSDVSGIVGPLALVTATAGAIGWDLRRSDGKPVQHVGLYVAAICGLLFVTAVRVTVPDSTLGRTWKLARSDYPPTQELRLADWARSNTSVEAVIMVPPEFNRFRLASERAIIADYKTNGLTDTGLIEWYDRIFAVQRQRHGNRPAPRDVSQALAVAQYDSASEREMTSIAAQYGADYVVARSSRGYTFPVVAHTEVWSLFHMADATTNIQDR